MFIGDNNVSCDRLCNAIFSVIPLTGGQAGLIDKIYSLRNLYDLEFLNEKGAIFCVTNPIFKLKTEAWDLMCEVDTGKLTLSEGFKKEMSNMNRESDSVFIKELMYKIKTDNLDNFQVEKYFKYYVNYLLDIFSDSIAVDDDDIVNDINKQWQRKFKIKQSFLFKHKVDREAVFETVSSNDISYGQIVQQTKNLLYRKYIDRSELKLIYNNILKFIENNDFAVALFLGLLMDYNGAFKVFMPLFSRVEEIAKICKNIINVIKKTKYKGFCDIVLNYAL
eukprot:CAMPEP_0170538670 /NCGR_PEP_ID=MMETSP0209-20121228/103458_1 /TAXON_ID=665100 ORGANISM="Litonotus pictus, Strain P1" /NCGR_SAMPLE_ID=MMETSP0209 /ASSEMBLY_ACC=CAM_ASM_000301 /LENGTH=277 /DNA_ID=CAMNT_0010840423 /DNA_START=1198 /DNA_END=2028 /DNA_ORIENTATION=-